MASRVVFIVDRCKGCLLCVPACPKKIIRQSTVLNRQGYKIAEVSAMDACTGCAACAIVCPDLAIRVFTMREGNPGARGEKGKDHA